MKTTTLSPPPPETFESFMESLIKGVEKRKIHGLDEGVIRPLFAEGPESLFAAAGAAQSKEQRSVFNRYLEWLGLHSELLPRSQRPMLAVATAAIQLVTKEKGAFTEADLVELDEAIRMLDECWANLSPVGAADVSLPLVERHPELKGRFAAPQSSLATWYVWDILMWLHQDAAVLRGVPFRTAYAPVLLVNPERKNGVVALLTIELLQDGGLGFTPIPESLGLTALDESFHQALQRAWELSGIEGWRGRWKLSRFPTSSDAINVSTLEGRSMEAAVCATLWSAFGGIPGTTETTPDAPIQVRGQSPNPVDLKTAITAQLGEKMPVSGKRSEMRLEPIEGLASKIKAARQAQLEAVVIADVQEPKQDEAWYSSTDALSSPPKRCLTIGQAWDQVHASVRYLRAYQAHIVETWETKWRDEVDVPEEVART